MNETQTVEVKKVETKKSLIELANQKEALLEQLKAVDASLRQALLEVGVNGFVQDPTNLVVYKVIKPEGHFIKFKDIDYVRTRKTPDEKADLAMGEAMEQGFDLGANGPKKPAKKA